MIWLMIIFHAMLSLLAVAVALYYRYWFSALMMPPGVVIGCYLAIVPLQRSMERSEAETGYDAGNAGIFFCCTVPIVPALGMFFGFAIGVTLDNRLGTPRQVPWLSNEKITESD